MALPDKVTITLYFAKAENRRSLETRFGEVPAAIRQQVHRLKDERELKDTLRQAVRIVRLEEFQAGTAG